MRTSFDVVGVIPARYESTRLKHKLLRTLSGKTLLQRTWEQAKKAHLLDKLIIACDHLDLKNTAEEFGGEAILTSTQHASGTDRIAEAVRDIDAKIVINIQADEPLMHPSIIDSLIREMSSNPGITMATVRKVITNNDEVKDPNTVKIVCDKDDFAIYFSRFPIPYYRQNNDSNVYYKHLGIYAYTKDFLYTFKNLPASYLEKAESLEQLRALSAGYKIKVIETQFDSRGVDTEEDLQHLEELLRKKND